MIKPYTMFDGHFLDGRWALLAAETSVLALDAATVMWLRLSRLALLDMHAAMTEWQKLAGEKVESALVLQARAAGGKLGRTQISVARGTVRHYRKAVAANRRSLMR